MILTIVYLSSDFTHIPDNHDEPSDKRSKEVDLNVFDPKGGLFAIGRAFEEPLEKDGSKG